MKIFVHTLAAFFALSIASVGQTDVSGKDVVPEVQAVPKLTESSKARAESATPNVSPSVGRPILFVHGWCGDAYSWLTTAQSVRNVMMSSNPVQYQNGQIYGVYYWGLGRGVVFYDLLTSTIVSQAQIPSSARFFVVDLIDPRQTGQAIFDRDNVAQIPISVKASEVAEVLHSIQDITYVQDSIVVAHSMGGLVTRAYVEGLGSPLSLANGQYLYTPGSLNFSSDLGSIITIDTPHSGAPVSISEAILGIFFPCGGLNRNEMIPGDPHSVVAALNYVQGATLNGVSPKTLPAGFPIHSIKSYNTFDWGGTPNSDGVVTADTQDIRLAFQNHIALTSNFQSLDNFEGARPGSYPSDCSEAGVYVLHFIECVGVHNSTLNLVSQSILSDMLGVPLGIFAVSTPQSLIGGATSSGNLTLTVGAPSHGATVQLSTDDPAAQVPSVVSLASGVSTANFNINTSTVNNQKTVHITAQYGRTANQVAAINVLPAVAQVQLSSTSVNFSNQLLNLRSSGTQVLITNSGVVALSISSITPSGPFEQNNNCPTALAVNATCAINVIFHPQAIGTVNGALTISDSAPGSPHVISLAGTGFDIAMNIPRPTRTRRGQNGAIAREETLISFNAVGGALPPIEVKCITEGCNALPISANIWNVAVKQKALRLGKRQSEVEIQVTVQGDHRMFVIPLI